MHVFAEVLLQATLVMGCTAGFFYWSRRRGKSNHYTEGLLWYDGALCAFLSGGLRVLGDKYVYHLRLSTQGEAFAILLLLAVGVLGFLRKTYASRLYRATLDTMNAQYWALMRREAARLEPYRWTNPSCFNAGYQFALENGETELAFKIRSEQPPEWSAGFVQSCLNRYEASARAVDVEERRS